MKLCLQPKHILGAILYRIPLFNKKKINSGSQHLFFKHIITSAHTKYCFASILSHIVYLFTSFI